MYTFHLVFHVIKEVWFAVEGSQLCERLVDIGRVLKQRVSELSISASPTAVDSDVPSLKKYTVV